MELGVSEAASVLHAHAMPIRAVQEGEVNRFSRALQVLEQIAQNLDSPLAIVGGLAGIHYQTQVTTLDINLVVAADCLDRFVEECERQGLAVVRRSPRGWHALEYQDEEGSVAVEIIPAGQRSPHDPEYAPRTPSPQELGVVQGIGFASFAGWVQTKLVANRDKDRYHLKEALKHATQQQVGTVVQALRKLDPIYLDAFEQLLREAEEENPMDW